MNEQSGMIKQSIVTGGLLYASFWARPYATSEDWMIGVLILWFITGLSCLRWVITLLQTIPRIITQRWIKRPKGKRGKARYAKDKEVRKAASNSISAYVVGMKKGRLIRFFVESSAMVLSPAGGGKTVCFVILNLLLNPTNMIVADLKGTLAVVTAAARRKKLGHKVFILNPSEIFADKIGTASRYNPLTFIINNWRDPKRHKHLLDDIGKFALQSLPEPVHSGDNRFFRNGSRRLLKFAVLYLVTQLNTVTLSQVLSLLSDPDELEAAIYIAKSSDVLNGDLARYAADLEGKLSGAKRDQFESFREGAMQVLEPYSASGALAESTSVSDFDIREFRKQKATLYVICDPTQASVYESWLGLIMTSFITELMRNAQGRDVGLMLDEVTNFKIENLPKLMTSAREFKIHMWLIIQELEQFAETYGRAAKDTLLSQTEIKILHGSDSQTTRELISRMAGDESYRETSYNAGRSVQDPVQRSISEQARKLITPEEVGEMSDMIIFKRGMAPFRLNKIGYHEIHPIRKWAAPNPYFGKKRYKGKIKVRL